jgi:hypothetical protein
MPCDAFWVGSYFARDSLSCLSMSQLSCFSMLVDKFSAKHVSGVECRSMSWFFDSPHSVTRCQLGSHPLAPEATTCPLCVFPVATWMQTQHILSYLKESTFQKFGRIKKFHWGYSSGHRRCFPTSSNNYNIFPRQVYFIFSWWQTRLLSFSSLMRHFSPLPRFFWGTSKFLHLYLREQWKW